MLVCYCKKLSKDGFFFCFTDNKHRAFPGALLLSVGKDLNMKVKAKRRFEYVIDTTVNRIRREGEIFDVNDERAKLLLKHHLIEILPEEIAERVIEKSEEIKTNVKKRGRPKKK